MKFNQYINLARKVYPDLPESLESMNDELNTYQFIQEYMCTFVHNCHRTDSYEIDKFSLSNATTMQIRHIQQFGKSVWEDS